MARSSADRAGRFSNCRRHGRIHGECVRNSIGSPQGRGFEAHLPQGRSVSRNTRRHGRAAYAWKTTLVLREWSCRFEACAAVISRRGGTAGSFPGKAVSGSGECRTELQPHHRMVWLGSTPTLGGALWHERGHPVSSTLVAAVNIPASGNRKERNALRMPAGLQGRAARRTLGGQVGCSIHPVFRWNA